MSPRNALILSLVVSLCALVSPAHATYKDLIGYPQLQALLGGSIPDGTGIPVHHVEARDASDNYMPAASSEFTSPPPKVFTNVSTVVTQGSTGTSGHSRGVGINFYGNSTSIAPGILSVAVWESTHWLGFDDTNAGPVATLSSFLNSTSSIAPDVTDARVANHSYIGSFSPDSTLLDVVRRIDYVVEEDDFVQVVGIQNGDTATDQPLLKSAMNVISVGRTDGAHREDTLQIAASTVYTAGRTAPHVVTPAFNFNDTSALTSFATPMVSAAVALMLETGQDSGLSNGMVANRTRTINHAETSEVLKATLMAGADRRVNNPRGADLSTYAIDTSNNLDRDFGAGQLNVFHNYVIQTAGEHDSFQTGDTADIGHFGWDYGTVSGTGDSHSYFFTASSSGTLFATLAWNADITDSDLGANFAPTEQLHDLDLLLVDVTAGDTVLLSPGASSQSTDQNTENVFYNGLVAGNRYELRVIQAAGQGAFDRDFGLAWRVIPEPSGVVLLTLGFVTWALGLRPIRINARSALTLLDTTL
jgi:hypothetical protein